jgi:hypothetical protein
MNKGIQLSSSRPALAASVAVGAAVAWIGNAFGLWWATLAVGCVFGLLLRGRGRIVLAALSAALAGWGLHLVWLSLHGDIMGAARVVAEIMGFGSVGFLVILLALFFGALLSLAGAWVGAVLRRALEAFLLPSLDKGRG